MAAQNGTITYQFAGGVRRTYSFYLDDTAGNPVRWSLDGKAGAASVTDITAQAPCAIADFVIAAASGQTTTTFKINDYPVSTILNANYLASVTFRPPLNLVMKQGDKLTAFQVA